MPISPYSKPADFQVQPLDWNKAFQVGAIQQKRHDDTEDEAYKLQSLLGAVPAIDEHKPFKQQLDAKYYQKLSDVYDKLDKNDIQGASRQLRRTALDFQNDPLKNELVTSYENRKQETEKKIGLGDKYAVWGDPNAGFAGTNPDGTIQPLRFKGFQERQDHQKQAEDMMNGLKPSGSDTKGFNLNANGDIISVKQGYEGIAADWVHKMAKLKALDFAKTIPGGDFIRQTQHHLGRNVTPQDIEDYLFHAGANQIFNKTTQEQDLNYAPEHVRETGSPTQDINLTSANIPQNNINKINLPGIGNDIINATGKIAKSAIKDIVDPYGANDSLEYQKPISSKETYKASFNPDQKKILDKAQKEFGEYPQTDYGQAELVNKYIEYHNSKLQYPGIQEYDPRNKQAYEMGQRETDFFFDPKKGSLAGQNRNYKLIQGDGDQQLTGNEFMKEYGNSDKYTVNVSGKLSPDNPYYNSGKLVTITDNSGKPVAKFAMSGTNSESNDPVNSVLHNMYQSKYNATGESSIELPVTEDINGKKQTTSKKYNIEYLDKTSRSLDDNGNPIVIGHIVKLVDPKTGQAIHKVEIGSEESPDPNRDAIKVLFNSLPR